MFITGSGFTTTLWVALFTQGPLIRVTVYSPFAARDARARPVFWTLAVKPSGPAQANCTCAGVPAAESVRAAFSQRGLLLNISVCGCAKTVAWATVLAEQAFWSVTSKE